MVQLDFKLYKGKTQEKSFTFRSEDGTYMDLTDSTVKFDIYNNGLLKSSINGTIDIETATVVFTFNSSILDWDGSYEYYIVKVKTDEVDVNLLYGNIILELYVPFSQSISSYLESELPIGFVPSVNFINQKTRYWRLFLQSAFDIGDSLLNVDSAWPELVNALIAKLIAHDTLMTSIRGNLITAFGENIITSEKTIAMGGDIKSIETGPSNVEFHPVSETLMQLLKSTTTGQNLLVQLSEDICGLAKVVAVKLPMCKAGRLVVPFQIGRKTIHLIDNTVSRG